MIVAESVGKRVSTVDGELRILSDINLQVEAASSVAIVGASGSGKSTLLALLAGLDTPSEGRITLAGKVITDMDEEARAAVRANQVGFVFQSFQLLPGLSALENVLLPLELGGVKDASSRAREFLERVGLSERLGHYPHQLSGGEQQRVALARAFANRPAILFADEPTGNLDQSTASLVNEMLFSLNQDSQTTLVLVTHDPALASRCQRQIRINGGRIDDADVVPLQSAGRAS